MKARLYRGPFDGKVVDAQGTSIKLAFMPDDLPLTALDPTKPLPYKIVYYHQTNHTHPDGSVFFEWSEPRGTKTGKKKRRKKFRNFITPTTTINYQTSQTGNFSLSGTTISTGPFSTNLKIY